MLKFLKSHIVAAALALGLIGAGAGFVAAQVMSVPQVANVGTTDLFQDIVNGTATAPNYFATAAQIAGAPGYQDLGVATSGNTYAFNKAQMNMIMRPAGTLAAVTLTAEPNPSDGQLECFLSTQTTTSLTWNANTTVNAQTISGAPTAGVANTRYCMLYNKAAVAWYRAQ